MTAPYSKSVPYLKTVADATIAAGLPDTATDGGWAELLRQQIAVENDFKDPSIIQPLAIKMRQLIDKYYSELKRNGATWRDIYAAAAGAYRWGTGAIDAAIVAGGVQYNSWRKSVPGVTETNVKKYIGETTGSTKSVIWDFNSWAWFDSHYNAAAPVSAKATGKKHGNWALFALAGVAALVLFGKKKKGKK